MAFRIGLRMLLAMALAPMTPLPGVAAGSGVTPEMFGALPAVSDVEISPSGKFLATLRTDSQGTFVAFQELDSQGAAAITRLQGAKARSLQWINDDVLLLLVSQTVRRRTDTGRTAMEAWRWFSISRKDMTSKMLFGDEPGYFILDPGHLLSAASDDGGGPVFSRWTSRRTVRDDSTLGSRIESRSTGGGISLFAVALEGGKEQLVAAGNGDTVHWIVDQIAKPLVRIDRSATPGSLDIYARKLDGGGLAKRGRIQLARDDEPVVFPEGRSIVDGRFLGMALSDGRKALVELDLETGKAGSTVFSHPKFDVEGVIYDPRLAGVTGVSFTDDLPRRRYLDPVDQRLQDSLATALPDAAPIIWSRSADGTRYVINAQYVDRAPNWFLYDRNSKALDIIAPGYDVLDGKVFARKEKFDYTTVDGMLVPGYLTVPAGTSQSRSPLIVLPHGGPHARDDQSFDYWSFFYAARGYLVYQPNFRGSSGYGQAFKEAGNGQWGRKMQDDITEGVRKLVADGVADPGRICIVGASYGGYAALIGATSTPDLYACVVSVAGIADVVSLVDPRDAESVAYWQERIGSRHDREAMRAISPMFQAASATAPILLIHGKDDTVVKVHQSRQMAKALRSHGKQVELVELDGEDHWLSDGRTRTEMLRRSIEFIDQHIGRAGR